MHPEIRIVRITEALGRYRSGALSCLEAAEVLGMSERHFRRLRERYEAEGADQGRRRGRSRRPENDLRLPLIMCFLRESKARKAESRSLNLRIKATPLG